MQLCDVRCSSIHFPGPCSRIWEIEAGVWCGLQQGPFNERGVNNSCVSVGWSIKSRQAKKRGHVRWRRGGLQFPLAPMRSTTAANEVFFESGRISAGLICPSEERGRETGFVIDEILKLTSEKSPPRLHNCLSQTVLFGEFPFPPLNKVHASLTKAWVLDHLKHRGHARS